MKWEKVKLGDIASFSNGINFNKTAYEKGVKLIGVSNFGDRCRRLLVQTVFRRARATA